MTNINGWTLFVCSLSIWWLFPLVHRPPSLILTTFCCILHSVSKLNLLLTPLCLPMYRSTKMILNCSLDRNFPKNNVTNTQKWGIAYSRVVRVVKSWIAHQSLALWCVSQCPAARDPAAPGSGSEFKKVQISAGVPGLLSRARVWLEYHYKSHNIITRRISFIVRMVPKKTGG